MRILIICTGNTCRSQMVEGFLRYQNPDAEIVSAGIHPELVVNPFAVRVMNEIAISIENQKPKSVEKFTNEFFDLVITVCDYANAKCPAFTAKVGHRLHIPFDDPAKVRGNDDEIMQAYRKTRDAIVKVFSRDLKTIISQAT